MEAKLLIAIKEYIDERIRVALKGTPVQEKKVEKPGECIPVKDKAVKKEYVFKCNHPSFSKTVYAKHDRILELINRMDEKNAVTHAADIRKSLDALLTKKIIVSEYVTFISCVSRCLDRKLDKIFKNVHFRKKVVMKTFTTVEVRLVRHRLYVDTYADGDDVKQFLRLIKNDVANQKKVKNQVLHNYMVAIVRIEDLLRILIKRVVDLNQYVKQGDVFYYAVSVDKNTINWREDYLLKQLHHIILGEDDLLTYCINLFRSIYLGVFMDNLYREKYRKATVVTRMDCVQLLKNIVLLADMSRLQETMISLMKEFCPDMVEGKHKISKRFLDKDHVPDESPDRVNNVILRIFDQINKEQVEEVLSSLIE